VNQQLVSTTSIGDNHRKERSERLARRATSNRGAGDLQRIPIEGHRPQGNVRDYA